VTRAPAPHECFIVLEGELLLDIEGRDTVVLGKHLGFTVPRASCIEPGRR